MKVRVLKMNSVDEVLEEISRFGEVESFLSSEPKPEKFVCVNLKIEEIDEEISSLISREVARYLNSDVLVSKPDESGKRNLLVSIKLENLEYLKNILENFSSEGRLLAEKLTKALNCFYSDFAVYKFGDKEFDFSKRTYIMGVLNVTPDSFSDGGKYFTVDSALAHAMKMIEDGADIIDIGGESTRPGSEPVSVEEELRRVIPVIKEIVKRSDIPISIDTYKAEVARQALDNGAVIVNDISGLKFDEKMAEVVSSYKASVIVMHIKGTPKTMQQNPYYDDVISEIYDYLNESVKIAKSAGIEQIIVDPGIGFGKRLVDNLEIIRRLREFKSLGYPVLIGVSRKSFIGHILNLPVDERLEGTAGAVAISVWNGANIVRVHDVKEMARVVKIVDAIKQVIIKQGQI
ncbi:MAG: dihydropteroate synthase [Candidatus Kryptonium sp.]|nr:dihydropteroate synthase [Candidatus Kryptonium sp.]MDW8108488.1 dihydropteroate synthase [Candidatus Kryptonium sp.]